MVAAFLTVSNLLLWQQERSIHYQLAFFLQKQKTFFVFPSKWCKSFSIFFLFYSTSLYFTPLYSTPLHSMLCYSTLPFCTLLLSNLTLLYATLCHSTLHFMNVFYSIVKYCGNNCRQASISTAFSSSPKLTQMFLFDNQIVSLRFLSCDG